MGKIFTIKIFFEIQENKNYLKFTKASDPSIPIFNICYVFW